MLRVPLEEGDSVWGTEKFLVGLTISPEPSSTAFAPHNLVFQCYLIYQPVVLRILSVTAKPVFYHLLD